MLDKVKSIKKIDNKSKRYDIGVESNNNFYANGILVHNCQNLKKEYEEWKTSGKTFYATEKLDGSSSTFYVKDGVFGVCSRNLELLETEDNTFWRVARHLGLEEKMSSLGRNISFQGELIGEGIQGNPYKIKGQTVKFFSIFDIDTQSKVGVYEFVQIIEELGLETVPILYDFVLPESVEKMLDFAEGKSQLNSNTEREGLVVRSYDMSISFKAISNKFLLKNEG